MTQSAILIVEDNEFNRDLLTELLECEYQLDYAVDGFQALQKTVTGRYDLVLLDITLPKMDGWKVASLVQAKMGTPPPILAVTAHSLEATSERLKQFGVAGYVSKPIDEDRLMSAIRELLG